MSEAMNYKLPPMPKPDTHCFDEDTGEDVWSHSPEQMQAYAIAAIGAQGVPDANAEFNRAIDFAIEQGIEAAVFLRCWREGDTSEWPEFNPMLASAPPAPKAKQQPISDDRDARIAELERQLEEARKQMDAQKDEWLSWEAKRKALEKDAKRMRTPQAWLWTHKESGSYGVYLEDPKEMGFSMESGRYEWVALGVIEP